MNPFLFDMIANPVAGLFSNGRSTLITLTAGLVVVIAAAVVIGLIIMKRKGKKRKDQDV